MFYKKKLNEHIFDIFNYLLLSCLVIVTLYPCLYVLFASVSDPNKIYAEGGLLLYPKGFDAFNYIRVFENKMIWVGYRNTVFYVLGGVMLSLFLTITLAYGLSRRTLPGKNAILFLIVFTMYFHGGLIPTFLLVKKLHITDSWLAMILPSAISTYNFIVTLSYFRGMPESLEEAAKLDGANDYTVLWKIFVPLAKPIIAVIALYYAVGIWNNYFHGIIYLTDRKYYPLQVVLREILIQNETTTAGMAGVDYSQAYAENIKYATIVVSTIPILCVYPFVQKYFVKGVMIGAVKG